MTNRRDFIKKAAYAAPVVVTLSAKPSFAGTGSYRDEAKTKESKVKIKGSKKPKKQKARGAQESLW